MIALKGTFLILVSFLPLLFDVQIFSQNKIPYSVICNGGEKQSNTAYVIAGTMGQTIIGKCENTIHQAQAGFWQMYNQDVLLDVEDEDILPIEYKLEQNYPNPFNPLTTIRYGIPERTNVLIKVYDILGSEVITLLNQEADAGWYNLEFNAARYSSGIYICRMQAGKYISTKKMLMIK